MAPKRGDGRPTKVSPEVTDRLCNYLRAGATIETACKAAGIGRKTFYRWLRTARDFPGGQYDEFAEAVARAQAEAELRPLARLNAAAQTGDTRADMYLLDRLTRRRDAYSEAEVSDILATVYGVAADYLLQMRQSVEGELRKSLNGSASAALEAVAKALGEGDRGEVIAAIDKRTREAWEA